MTLEHQQPVCNATLAVRGMCVTVVCLDLELQWIQEGEIAEAIAGKNEAEQKLENLVEEFGGLLATQLGHNCERMKSISSVLAEAKFVAPDAVLG